MPQLANIVISDGAATPVAHTFAPVTTDGLVAQLAERLPIPVSNPKLDVSVRAPVGGNGTYRVKLTLKTPSTVLADGVTKVDHTPSMNLELVFSERSTEQERKNLRVLTLNALQNALLVAAIEKLEPLY